MTEPNSAGPEVAETADILRFLHRFADLMANGSNSENLLHAANMLQAHTDRLQDTERLLEAEQAKTAQHAEQQSRHELAVAEMERRQSELLLRAEQAEARLQAIQAAPPAVTFGSVAVPLSILRVAKAQFESLARGFVGSGDIVSQVMCEASASTLDRVMADADADDKPEQRPQHAA